MGQEACVVRRRAFTLFAAAAALGLAMATPVPAQQATSTVDELQEIVVTARRVEERLQDVPISISVFNQQQLADRNIVTASDLALYTPSLSSSPRFGPDNASFAIRGFVQEGPTSPSVAVYFADVVAPRAQGGTTAGNGAGVGSLFDLQNVEVLKGPQGTLFGRNTTGGAILLVPKKPTSDFEGYLEGTVGNDGLWRTQAVVNAPLNDSVRFRLGVDHEDTRGYLNNVSGIGPSHFGDVGYTAVRASLVIDITPNLENYTILSWSDSDTHGSYPKIFANEVPGAAGAATTAQIAQTSRSFYDVANGDPNARQWTRQWGLINTTTWHVLDDLTIKNIASYTEFRQLQNENIFGESMPLGGSPPLILYDVGLGAAPGHYNVAQSTTTEELQIQGNTLDSRLTYQAGGYLELSDPLDGFQTTYAPIFLACSNVNAFQCTDVIGLAAGAQGAVGFISSSATHYFFRDIGAYSQATYKFTEQWSLTAGIRYTNDWSSGLGQAVHLNFPAPDTPLYSCANPVPLVQGGTAAQIQANNSLCNFYREQNSARPTWLLDLDYKPIEDVLLYAKYARGYRQGDVNVSSYGLESWKPETVDTYEIGSKTSFRGPIRGTFNVAAFYNDFRNQQIQVNTTACTLADEASNPKQCPFLASPAAGIANAGKSRIEGVEVDSSISPFNRVRLDVGYAYLDTRLLSVALPAVPVGLIALQSTSVVGGPLSMTPKHKLTLNGSYSLPVPESIGQLTLGATYTYQSSFYNTSTAAPGFTTLGSQKNLNLYLNWDSIANRPFDLQLFATNVTDEHYYLVTIGGSFGFDSAYLNQPLMYGLRLRYHFGPH
jgi:iron complex outermembrane recepter protein